MYDKWMDVFLVNNPPTSEKFAGDPLYFFVIVHLVFDPPPQFNTWNAALIRAFCA